MSDQIPRTGARSDGKAGSLEFEANCELPLLSAREFKEALERDGTLKDIAVRRPNVSSREFSDSLVFDNVEFRGGSLGRAKYKGSVTFKHCTFAGVDFQNAVFEAPVTFENCRFAGLNWRRVTFVQGLRLRRARIAGKCRVTGVSFGGYADFWETNFDNWAEFQDCTFAQTADLRSIDADAGLVFKKTRFAGDLLLRGAIVQRKLEFRECVAERLVDFSKAKLFDFAYVEGLEFGPEATFAVWNAIPQALMIRRAQIEGRLVHERAQDWERSAEEYGVLKATWNRLHWFDEEDWAYVQFKRCSRRARPSKGPVAAFGRALDWLVFDLGSQYGTNPLRALTSAVTLILGFAALYFFFIGHFQPYQLLSDLPATNIADRVLNALLFSASAFVTGFDAIDKNVSGWLAVPLVLEGLLGFLLMGLFIVSFSRKVIR